MYSNNKTMPRSIITGSSATRCDELYDILYEDGQKINYDNGIKQSIAKCIVSKYLGFALLNLKTDAFPIISMIMNNVSIDRIRIDAAGVLLIKRLITLQLKMVSDVYETNDFDKIGDRLQANINSMYSDLLQLV